jgi:hypothetical protein
VGYAPYFYRGQTNQVTVTLGEPGEFLTFDSATYKDDAGLWSVTNKKLTPNVAGFWELHTQIRIATTTDQWFVRIRKNGTIVAQAGSYVATSQFTSLCCSSFQQMNGTTDYWTVELVNVTTNGRAQGAGSVMWGRLCIPT